HLRVQQRADPRGRPRVLRDGARRAVLRGVRRTERREGAGVGPAVPGAVGGAPRAAADLPSGDARVRQSLQHPAVVRRLGGALLLHSDDRGDLPPAQHAAGRRAAISRARLSRRPGALHRRGRRHSARAVHLPPGHDVAGAGHRAARRTGVFRLETEVTEQVKAGRTVRTADTPLLSRLRIEPAAALTLGRTTPRGRSAKASAERQSTYNAETAEPAEKNG